MNVAAVTERALSAPRREAQDDPRFGLTRRQADCLQVIRKHVEEHGIAPSVQELAERLGLVSKGGVVRILKSLEERGYLTRLAKRARSIVLIEPLNKCPNCGHAFQASAR